MPGGTKTEVIKIRCSKETKVAFKKFVAESDSRDYEEALRKLLAKAGLLGEPLVF